MKYLKLLVLSLIVLTTSCSETSIKDDPGLRITNRGITHNPLQNESHEIKMMITRNSYDFHHITVNEIKACVIGNDVSHTPFRYDLTINIILVILIIMSFIHIFNWSLHYLTLNDKNQTINFDFEKIVKYKTNMHKSYYVLCFLIILIPLTYFSTYLINFLIEINIPNIFTVLISILLILTFCTCIVITLLSLTDDIDLKILNKLTSNKIRTFVEIERQTFMESIYNSEIQ
jgi:hypothetical protein